MIPVAYAVPGELTSPQFAAAFADGCGGRVCETAMLGPEPAAVFGSPARWDLIQQAMAEGRCVYADHGYFGRGRFYRVTVNRYQHDGTGEAGPQRFERFGISVRPWKRSGRTILICPNSSAYFRLFGLNVREWIADIEAQLATLTDRPIRVRWKDDHAPIAVDLVDAWAVITFSSAAAIEALIAGVPVFVLAPFAAAARMGSSDLADIERPCYPDDREPFVWNLAANQWSLSEIRGGKCWQALEGVLPS